MSNLLEAKDVAIGYDDIVLSGLSFKINLGDFICLMGENGCGKSTILRTISSFLEKKQGVINIQGREISTISCRDLSRIISIVLTHKMTLENRTVREVISLGRIPHANFFGGLSLSDWAVIDAMISRFDLVALKDRMFDQLSDGQKQRIMICRAFVQQTPLVILDEPTTFLDMGQRFEVMLLIKEIAAETNTSVLFSSHDWELALAICSSIWLIDKAGKLESGLPEEMILNGQIAGVFEGIRSQMDMKTGLIVPHNDLTTSIALSGTDCNGVRWTQHALEKLGVGIDGNSAKMIVVTQEGWTLKTSQNNWTFRSLQRLLDYLSKPDQE